MPVQCTCFTCGKSLLRSPSKVEPRNYCSRACKHPPRVQCVCLACGKPFSRIPSSVKGRTYCSKACGAVRWQPPVAISEDGQTAKIPLFARDESVRDYAIVDTADVEWLTQWRWSLIAAGYAVRVESRDGRSSMIYMHRAILELGYGDKTKGDHINRNRLDNRRANLRPVNDSISAQNVGGSINASSRYRGVTWSKQHRKWKAQISLNGKNTHLGLFEREEDAAETARSARQSMMPGAMD